MAGCCCTMEKAVLDNIQMLRSISRFRWELPSAFAVNYDKRRVIEESQVVWVKEEHESCDAIAGPTIDVCISSRAFRFLSKSASRLPP